MDQWTGSKLEKEYVKAVYCHLAYLTYLQSTSCEITGSVKDQLELRFQGKLSITSDMQMVLFLSESEEKLKNLLMKMKEESEKADLKLSIQKTKVMTSDPITLWQIDGETVKTVADFIFLGSKITTDGNCSNEIQRRLLLGRQTMTKPDSILKSREITLPTKVHLVKAMLFPVVMYGCESWIIKKAEH